MGRRPVFRKARRAEVKRGRHERPDADDTPIVEPRRRGRPSSWWWAILVVLLLGAGAVTAALQLRSTSDTVVAESTIPNTTATVAPRIEGPVPPLYPYGPHVGSSGGWDLVDDKFTSAHFNPSEPAEVLIFLNEAQSMGKSVVLLFAGPASRYKNDDGTFSLEKWKAEVDLYAHLDLDEWIADGTIFVHYLISEPMSRSRWGGEVITAAVLDEMAAYSKQFWPDLPTVVREQPTDLALHAGGYETPIPDWTWSHLDASWARYRASKGPIDEFINAEVEAARSQGLGLLFGMNVLQGGDGSSNVIGYNDDWVMSPQELLNYGEKLINEPYGCAMLMWHLNFDDIVYFDVPEIAAAMDRLSDLALNREPRDCLAS